MAEASRDFANDPLCSQKRMLMVKASRDLLGAVSRLLTLADMIDVGRLLRAVQQVQLDLQSLKQANNQVKSAASQTPYSRD